MTEANKASNDKTGNAQTKTEAAEQRAASAAHALDARLSGPLAPLESALNDAFGEKATYQLPKEFKELLVKIAPWLALISGVLGLLTAFNLWQFANRVNRWRDAIDQSIGAWIPVEDTRLELTFWFAIVAILLFSVLALLAFPGLKSQKKVGWNLMFYSMIASIAYSIVSLFYSGGVLIRSSVA